MTRIERVASPLPRECSTTEPHGPRVIADNAMSALLLALAVPLRTDFALASRIHGVLDNTVAVFVECVFLLLTGAGEGNRTLVVSLEGFCSTIELHPPDEYFSSHTSAHTRVRVSWWRRLDSNQRRRKPTDLQSAPFNHSGTPPRRTANYGCGTKACQTGAPKLPHCSVVDSKNEGLGAKALTTWSQSVSAYFLQKPLFLGS